MLVSASSGVHWVSPLRVRSASGGHRRWARTGAGYTTITRVRLLRVDLDVRFHFFFLLSSCLVTSVGLAALFTLCRLMQPVCDNRLPYVDQPEPEKLSMWLKGACLLRQRELAVNEAFGAFSVGNPELSLKYYTLEYLKPTKLGSR